MPQQNTVKTVHHAQLELKESLDIPFTVEPYSTINEKFAVQTAASVPANLYPTIKYLGIGRGGHRNVTGVGGASLVDILQHRPTDAVCFEHIPWVIRPVASDLSAPDRAKYRMRVRVNNLNGGGDYYLYYLKVIDLNAVTPETRILTYSDGELISDAEYIPSSGSQNPIPADVSNTIVNTVEGDHIVTQAVLTISLDAQDVQEIVDACVAIYGDSRYATVSEAVIVSGFDQTVSADNNGSPVVMTEVTHAQVMTFIGTEMPLQHLPTSASFSYALASTQPYPPTE